MDFKFQCDCGYEISDFTRSNTLDENIQIACEECGTAYAVTITQLATVK